MMEDKIYTTDELVDMDVYKRGRFLFLVWYDSGTLGVKLKKENR